MWCRLDGILREKQNRRVHSPSSLSSPAQTSERLRSQRLSETGSVLHCWLHLRAEHCACAVQRDTPEWVYIKYIKNSNLYLLCIIIIIIIKQHVYSNWLRWGKELKALKHICFVMLNNYMGLHLGFIVNFILICYWWVKKKKRKKQCHTQKMWKKKKEVGEFSRWGNSNPPKPHRPGADRKNLLSKSHWSFFRGLRWLLLSDLPKTSA